jgi:hypothetical protein
MKKVLWIEDAASMDLADLSGPVIMCGKYDLDTALDATEAGEKIARSEYDAVVVDIRIPPGWDQAWVDYYAGRHSNKTAARLGLQLLHSLLAPERAQVRIERNRIPSWVTPTKIGILSVETRKELEDDLRVLGVRVQREKRPDRLTDLLEVIEEIIALQG